MTEVEEQEKEVKEIVFDVKVDGQTRSVTARKPTAQEHRQGQKVYNQAFKEALTSGAILRIALEDEARKQGVWDDEKQIKLLELSKVVDRGETALKKGGIKLSKAKEIAIQIDQARADIMRLLSKKNSLDEHTAEAQADNEKFNYFVSCCLVYNDTKKPVFKDLGDYYNNANEEYAVICAVKLSNLLYGIKENYYENLPERKFLTAYGFMDKAGDLLDDQGRKIDRKGRLIDAEGFLINENGQRINIDGELVEGEVEFTPFLDEDEQPIADKQVSETGETETETETETE